MFFKQMRIQRLHKRLLSDNSAVRIDAAMKLFSLGEESVREILIEAIDLDICCNSIVEIFAKMGRLSEIMNIIERRLLTTSKTNIAGSLYLLLKMYGNNADEREKIVKILSSLLLNKKSSDFPFFSSEEGSLNPIIFGLDGEWLFKDIADYLGKHGNLDSLSALESAANDPSKDVIAAAANAKQLLKKTYA